MTRLLLVRHGESTWNAQRRWQGQFDSPLSSAGEDQARRAAAEMPPGYQHIVTSDLGRAARTAEILGAVLELTVAVEPRLRERYAGPWQGLTRAEIDAEWPGMLADGRRPHDYEPDTQVLDRALAALGEIDPDTIVVTHGGVIRVLEAHAGVRTARIANLSALPVELVGESVRLGTRLLLAGEGTVPAEAGGE